MNTLVTILVALALIGCSSGDQNGCYDEVFGDRSNNVCNEKPADYKQEAIDELVKQNVNWKNFNFPPFENDKQDTEYDNENCATISEKEQPFVITKNESSIISRHVIVQSEYFKQNIRVTKCKNLRESCLGSVFSDSGRTSCEQKMGFISLYVYDEASHQIKYLPFERPLCCYCKIKTEPFGVLN